MSDRLQSQPRAKRVLMGCIVVFSGIAFQFAGACEYLLTTFDPCGTILANCTPGTFDLLFADIPDWGVDPTCTIPGGCTDGAPFVSPFAVPGTGVGTGP